MKENKAILMKIISEENKQQLQKIKNCLHKIIKDIIELIFIKKIIMI